MAENKILQFAGDAAALVLTDVAYAADYERLVGNQPGIARADFVNKALKQSSFMSVVLAQFIVDYAEEDVQDDNSVAVAVANFLTALQLSTGFPAGTKMVFFQAAAPAGWTKDSTYNDMALRVVSGAGGGIGGTHNFSTPPSTAHVHAGPIHTHSTPSHYHAVYIPINGYGGTADTVGVYDYMQVNNPGNYARATVSPLVNTNSVSGGESGAAGNGNTESGSPTVFAPKYIDVIVCTKS